ncbi:MAG TPA: hypothetical protein VFX18_02620, partial [Candidatus Nitrosocosmicus sp.]|nr:hypothetical protein [Candidatus Nitrosocosmicus sp.]
MIINKDKDKPQSLSYQTEAFKTYFQYNKYYYDLCTSIAFSDKPVFELNYEDLITYNDNELLTFFENDYDRALKSLKKAVSETMIELADIDHTNKNNPKHLSIRLKNYGIATS